LASIGTSWNQRKEDGFCRNVVERILNFKTLEFAQCGLFFNFFLSLRQYINTSNFLSGAIQPSLLVPLKYPIFLKTYMSSEKKLFCSGGAGWST
jgi:hypothetical protein